MPFLNLFKKGRHIKLHIKDRSFILSSKGKMLSEKKFETDQECFELLPLIISKRANIASIECAIAGSKLISSTKTITRFGDSPFSASKELMENLIKEAEHSFLEDLKDNKLEIITSEVVSIKLNGYDVSMANGQKTKDLRASIFIAAIPSEYKARLTAALSVVPKKSITLSSFALESAQAIHQEFKTNDFIVCRVDEDTAEISVKKSNGFFETATVPIGIRRIVDHMKTGLEVPQDKAEDLLQAYEEGKLPEEKAKDVSAALVSFQISRDREVKEALTIFAQGISLPRNVYLSVPPHCKKACEEFFSAESYHSVLFTDKGFEVKVVEEKALTLL